MRNLLIMLACGLVLMAGSMAPSNTAAYKKITAEEAKQMLDTETAAILLDVRTQKEYDKEHIPGAILLPSTDIETKAAEVLPEKDALILVYCRSGSRSKSASQTLVALGYTRVFDFGGITDWPYDTETAEPKGN